MNVMSKNEKILWALSACALVLLFLMSSTNLIIKEKKVEIHPISVIIEDSNDDFYGNFRKGMDKAALEYHADISFITLYERNDQEQQLELINREIKDGAKAVILTPVNERETIRALDRTSLNSPLVVLGSQVPNEIVVANVVVDGYEMGEKLGNAVAAHEPKENPVYLFTDGLEYGLNLRVYDGVRTVLEQAGFTCTLVERRDGDTYRGVIEETVYPGSGRAAIVALDTPSLGEAAQILEDSSVYHQYITGLYGVGGTTALLNQLDQGIITGLVTYNRYDEGYLSVERAVEAIEGSRQREQILLDSYYIEKPQLRDKQYEKMLYPMD